MKKLLLLALAACLPLSMVMAQPPDPANFHIYYGTTDGSVINTGINKALNIPCWGSTNPTPGNPDSVTFMWNALSSDDQYIAARNGGTFPAFGVGLWDDKSFLTPNLDSLRLPLLWTNQGMLGFAYLTDPRDPQNFLYTLGAIQLICTFGVTTDDDPALIGQTVCPFGIGWNKANGQLLWGMQDGVRGVVPTQQYACIFFSPNAEPTWVDLPPADITILYLQQAAFDLKGTDTDDPLQTLAIIKTAGPGTVIPVGTGLDRPYVVHYVSGPLAPGDYSVEFTLSDGQDYAIPNPFVVAIHVVAGSALGLGYGPDDCISAMPGSEVDVPLNLTLGTPPGQCGGFELLINADPTAALLLSIVKTPLINLGTEYFNWQHDTPALGNHKFIWISDINNGHYNPPMYAPGGEIITLHYRVASGLPFGWVVPIEFIRNDTTDNSISDSSGYFWLHPPLTNGCIKIEDFSQYRGDPNFN
jgi:hypothetical protein